MSDNLQSLCFVGRFQPTSQVALRESFAKLVRTAPDKLASGADGKAKKVNDAMLPKIQEFLETFRTRNTVQQADQLEVLVQQAEALLSGVDTSSLQHDEDVRMSVLCN